MAQYTVNLDPAYGAQVTIRLCRPSSKEAVTFTIRNGETIVSDDTELIRALESCLGLPQPVLTTRSTRPPAPTHDVDRKPREPEPRADTKEVDRAVLPRDPQPR